MTNRQTDFTESWNLWRIKKELVKANEINSQNQMSTNNSKNINIDLPSKFKLKRDPAYLSEYQTYIKAKILEYLVAVENKGGLNNPAPIRNKLVLDFSQLNKKYGMEIISESFINEIFSENGYLVK